MKRLELAAGVSRAMRDHAGCAWPRECCGALLADADGVVVKARPLENVAPEPGRAFQVSARDYLRLQAEAEAQGLTLAGFYHSHPDAPATPSGADRVAARAALWTVIIPVAATGPGLPRAFHLEGSSFSSAALVEQASSDA